MSASDMDAYRDVFLAESADYLQQITDGLLALEAEPTDTEPVEIIFRGAHSLKGMSAAMSYERTADLAHKMEGLMDRVRKDEIAADRGVIELMLTAVDLLKDLIDDESNGGSSIDPSEMIAALESRTKGDFPAEEPSQPVATSQDEAAQSDSSARDGGDVAGVELAAGEALQRITVTLDESCVLKAVRAYMVLKRLSHIGRVVDTVPSTRAIEDEEFDHTFEVVFATGSSVDVVRDAVIHVSEVAACEVVAVNDEPDQEQPEVAEPAEPRPHEPARKRRRAVPKLSETQTVRVSIGHLDTLVDLVGELVILRSRLESVAGAHPDSDLGETLDELHRISTDLQYEVMQTRMVPVGNIFNRFPRMVRDLAVDLGKQIEFQMEGLDIELDRTVLDEIGDPLVHLLRNSIDHGIEPPDVRDRAGKPAVGSVRLSAIRERDHVAIVVSDDGRGIDIERVWSKALERGLVAAEERAAHSDDDILLMTCVAGFSTAEKATKVSGRGVGMDVVKGKIEHLGGTLQIRSCVGRGTDFVLRLPLTLAIVQALLVESGGQWFALPLSSVEEVYSAADVVIDTIDDAPVLILRNGDVVPLRRLDSLLYGADPNEMPAARSSIVLVQAGGDTTALSVDSLGGRREIVLKPLAKLFRDTKGFSGATILGDGRVMLVIDPRTIFSAQEA